MRQLRIPIVMYASMVLPILGIGALSAVLLNAGGERGIHEVSVSFGAAELGRINVGIGGLLTEVRRMNELHAALMADGIVDPADPAELAALFRASLDGAPAVSSIYFGNAAGGLIDAGREANDTERYLIRTDGFAAGAFRKYPLDEFGRTAAAAEVLADFDARTRPWFRTAVAAAGPAWTEPFVLFTGQDSAISAVRPVYSAAGRLVGVLSIDLFLNHLAAFLNGRNPAFPGEYFILGPNGQIIAASSPAGNDGLIAAALSAIDRPAGAGGAAARAPGKAAAHVEFRYGDGGYLAFASGVDAAPDLAWRIGAVFPDSAFVGRMRQYRDIASVLILITVLVGAYLSALFMKAINKPFRDLTVYAAGLAAGKWPDPPPASAWRETETLRLALATMSAGLKRHLDGLTDEVTSQSDAATKARAELGEKNLILREVHHRVKNNLGALMGLLELQQQLQDDPRVAAALTEANTRVASMMQLYENLFRSENFRETDCGRYLTGILAKLADQFDPARRIRLTLNLASIMLRAEVLMPIGIIANEAVTNAYKYAFPDGRAGSIDIQLELRSDFGVLTIRDDGIGLPAAPESAPDAAADSGAGGFGMELMRGLADQLRGQISFDSDRGTRVALIFPVAVAGAAAPPARLSNP